MVDPAKIRPILIVDDDEGVRTTLKNVLLSRGFKDVETAIDGADGLAHLRVHEGAHTILLDLMMPEMNGWEFLTRVQGKTEFGRHRIAVISGGDPQAADRGPYPFFSKPFDFDRLCEFCSSAA